MARPILSVVIPTHDRLASLAKTLDSFEGQDFDPSFFEIIVVSNLDDPNVTRLCDESILPVRCRHVGRLGVNRARNLGLEVSKGEVVYFVDDDCRLVGPDHLSRLVQAFREENEISMRGGPYETPPLSSNIGRSYNSVVNAWMKGRPPSSPLMAGGNLAVVRNVVGDVRFDETIEYGGSEVSFQLELLKLGVRAKWDERMIVEHHAELTIRDCIRKAWRQGISKRENDIGSGARALIELRREPLEAIVFGICYGGIARAGWLYSMLASGFDSSDASGILEQNANFSSGSREGTSA